jgi:hypothetical protein
MDTNQSSAPEQYSNPRRFPRVPLKTPVEVWTATGNAVGETENISAGGMLLRCQQMFGRGAELTVLFNLSAGFSIQTTCSVVHTLPESRMGLQFLGLSHHSQAELNDFLMQLLSYTRRGMRIDKRLVVTVTVRRGESYQEELAETVMLSQHGGLLVCRGNFQEDEDVSIYWPAGKRSAVARIAHRRAVGPSGLIELGFEFRNEENFWGLEFPPDS